MLIADHRIYLNRERTAIVDEDDPEASFLLAAEGNPVSAEDAEKYGLKPQSKAIHAGQVEDKALHGPSNATAAIDGDPNVVSEAGHTRVDEVSGVIPHTGQFGRKARRKG